MIKVEHKHGKITHSHFGGDVEHDHPIEKEKPGKPLADPMSHYHGDIRHSHKGGQLEHNHPSRGL